MYVCVYEEGMYACMYKELSITYVCMHIPTYLSG